MGLFDNAVPGAEHEIAVLRAGCDREGGGDEFARPKLQQVDDRSSLGGPAGFGDGIALDPERSALIGEEHDIGVRGGDEDILKEVLLTSRSAGNAHTAPALSAVGILRNALDIAVVGAGDDHGLLLDDVVHIDILNYLSDLRTTLIGIPALYLQHLIAYHAQELALVGKDAHEVFDLNLQLVEFGLELGPFKTGEPLQPHVQYRLCLPLGKAKARDKAFLCLLSVGTGFDNGDNLVDIVQCDHEAFQDMKPLPCLVKIELCPSGNDVLLVLQIVVQHLAEVQHLRLAVHKCNHDNAEGILELGVLIEVVQYYIGIDILLQFDDYAHSLA